MVIKARENLIGAWAFFLGVILAILIGLAPLLIDPHLLGRWISIMYGVLVVLGIIVGILNIRTRDTRTFLLAAVSLVIVSYMGLSSGMETAKLIGVNIGSLVISIFNSLLILFVPATIIVALRTVFNISSI